MIWALALAVGVALGAGVYLALSRDVLRIVLGLAIAGSAVNLALFASGRLGSAQPAVVPPGQLALEQAANPLPQALVLTAIVISFALVCFALVLALRLIQRVGSDDAALLRQAEPPATDPVKPPLTPPAFEPAWPPRADGGAEDAR
ncbi:Na(+)/H(+) antiporter subunit C1 [Tepidimonas alkaliphilus]|uniref:Na(+)/H(+) antiporter subunit C1 n=1 Tax=Tepidimonas alkaliphilus TaxID=2588942 RepID=A0A554W8D6_9BURK|nr:NADH-quinone oxidoreductase subunit K [Tepidimonas alkaliphilus]TSE19842.1 Na(+)/H(+) antiporter subunit C1 [Tepidimonas alkaliphilus]